MPPPEEELAGAGVTRQDLRKYAVVSTCMLGERCPPKREWPVLGSPVRTIGRAPW